MNTHKRSESNRIGVSIGHILDDIARTSGDTSVSTAVINLLEPLEFEVHVVKGNGRKDVRYVLTVRHRGAHTMWQHHRSFDEYEAFQMKVLRGLHHGHLCSGGCPWLESFIGAAFETTRRSITKALSTVIERRRKTTLEVIQAHRRFLVNRVNHVCAYTLHHVARTFLEFVYGGVLDSSHVMDQFLAAAAVAPPSKTHDDMDTNSTRTKSAQRRLRAQSGAGLAASKITIAAPATSSPHPMPAPDNKPELCAICEDSMPVKDVYIVRLSCGHRFHDECAMSKLNQQLQCPTCHIDLV